MTRLLLALLLLVFAGPSCNKFLDKKPFDWEETPDDLDDLQELLDNSEVMNSSSISSYCELVADNYYLTQSEYESFAASGNLTLKAEIENYTWSTDATPISFYWDLAYQNSIKNANIVLDLLGNLTNGEENKAGILRGSALFHRAFGFLNLAQLYCRPYSEAYKNEPGIILRLTSNIDAPSVRFTVEGTYVQIIGDLEEAAALLPDATTFPTRPSKTAAYAALARTYLLMGEYDRAGHYADLVITKHPLLDYNTIQSIERFNPEVIFHSFAPGFGITLPGVHRIDPSLYNAYAADDLRKTFFFEQNANDNTWHFHGSYNGHESPGSVFDGFATDEMYLIRAECAARENRIDAALTDLNDLLLKRWNKNATWIPFASADAKEVLDKILLERRKELVWRGLRWSDIRRYNAQHNGNIGLERKVGNLRYTLPPNHCNSVMPTPRTETPSDNTRPCS